MDEKHLARLCEDFALGTNPRTEENLEGVLNKNYILTTDEGRYFVKSVRAKKKSTITHIVGVEEYFYRKGIPAVCMLQSRDGSVFVQYGDKVYTVYPLVEHDRSVVFTDDDFREMGAMLAKIHHAGSREVPETLKILHSEKDPDVVRNTLLEYRTTISQKVDRNDTDTLFLTYIDLKLSLFDAAVHVEQLPFDTLVHGDFHARNLLFGSDKSIVGICDWEKACMHARSYELARSLMYICFESDNTEVSIASSKAFIEGYNSIYPISQDELIAGFKLRWRKLVLSIWIEDQHYMLDDHRADQFVPHEMSLMHDFADQGFLLRLTRI